MQDAEWLAEQFRAHHARLRAIAYRMLGSPGEADDAVQECWLRLSRGIGAGGEGGAGDVRNAGAFLTTVVARVCIDALRSRAARREDPVEHLPEPLLSLGDSPDPEHRALVADAVGIALLIVLDTLPPAERLAFVLHDMFAVPFEEIGPIVGRSATAARQLASRARRRVQAAPTSPDPDLGRQRRVVEAFLTAARGGDLEGLIAVLDPDVVLHADTGNGVTRLRGAVSVAGQASMFARNAPHARAALVNGAAGLLVTAHERPIAVLAFIVAGDRIVELDIFADPSRLAAPAGPVTGRRERGERTQMPYTSNSHSE